jgi:hypothetical protein
MPDRNLTTALAAFHAELPKVGKGALNPAFKSKYADLADIVAVVLPALAKQGLAWITLPTVTEDGFFLEYELRHEAGESVKGRWPLPDPSKATAQQLGSAVTYAKRYALSAVTGIAPDEDDDGNAASAKGAPRAKQPSAREKIDAAVNAIDTAPDAVELDRIEAHAISLGLAGTPDVKTALEKKRKELGASGIDHWGPVAEVPK